MRIGLLLAAGTAVAGCMRVHAPAPFPERPNFLVVIVDDLGWGDLGAYGAEIRTPTLDALAESGFRATDFYVAPDGMPTRAMLLTGVDHHLVARGELGEAEAESPGAAPEDEGHLAGRVPTVASLLREAGYHTYMAGRWGLGSAPSERPAARGFERDFTLLTPAASHWSDMVSAISGQERALYTENGEVLDALPEDYFSTRHFTDFLIESIDEHRGDGRPFFAYLAYQAPHSPLAAPEDWVDRYAGRYDEGYDEIRKERLLRMKRIGLVHEEVRPFPGIPTVPRWEDLSEEQQRHQARKMELYAAMVENLDFHLGRLIDHLRETGELDRTVVFFLSDNGASPKDRGAAGMDFRDREWLAEAFPESDFESWGRPGSFVEYGPAWAQVSTVPFRMFKGTQAEGGIRSPLIVSGPGVARVRRLRKKGRVSSQVVHVMDLAPTFLELAGVEYPPVQGAAAAASLHGRSLVPLLKGERLPLLSLDRWLGADRWLGFELDGDRAIRHGKWKLVWMDKPFGAADWQLYRLDHDPSELFDRSATRTKEKQKLLTLWEEYARAVRLALPQEEGPPAGER
jgi:arylsulfatase